MLIAALFKIAKVWKQPKYGLEPQLRSTAPECREKKPKTSLGGEP
jgi:hypothetical protein